MVDRVESTLGVCRAAAPSAQLQFIASRVECQHWESHILEGMINTIIRATPARTANDEGLQSAIAAFLSTITTDREP